MQLREWTYMTPSRFFFYVGLSPRAKQSTDNINVLGKPRPHEKAAVKLAEKTVQVIRHLLYMNSKVTTKLSSGQALHLLSEFESAVCTCWHFKQKTERTLPRALIRMFQWFYSGLKYTSLRLGKFEWARKSSSVDQPCSLQILRTFHRSRESVKHAETKRRFN